MQRTIERLRRKMNRTHRIIVSGVLVFGLLLALFSVLLSLDVVTITDSNGASHVLVTTSRQPQEILQLAGVNTTHNDQVIYTDNGINGTNIVINRSFSVSITADGASSSFEVSEGTVADALAAEGIVLGENDFVEPAADTALARDMSIYVRRVEYAEETRRIEVSGEDVEAYKAALAAAGNTEAFVESKSRIYDAAVRTRLVDGARDGQELLSLAAVYHPYDEPSASFEKGVAVSTIDEFLGVSIAEDGLPTNYSRKIEAICTAYSASAGRGAGGQGLYCGTVAVNPNIIPYGTRLYIAAEDGSFVYGYAIASDTGIAMMDGYVDIDLYFESNAECRSFGKRVLNVYVLD